MFSGIQLSTRAPPYAHEIIPTGMSVTSFMRRAKKYAVALILGIVDGSAPSHLPSVPLSGSYDWALGTVNILSLSLAGAEQM